jgi:hypothetical protein
MNTAPSYGAHSAQVKMRLLINGSSIRIMQMGGDFLLIEPGHEYPPGEASIFLKVDASETHWKVTLPQGISKSSDRVALASCQ